jgi:hypothetical protein
MLRLLARVIGIGIETADMLVQEVLARNMRDRRAPRGPRVKFASRLTGMPVLIDFCQAFSVDAECP